MTQQEEKRLSLKWNHHLSTFTHYFKSLREMDDHMVNQLSDATIVCQDRSFAVHKLILCMASDYFAVIFGANHDKYPILILKDIAAKDMEALLNYMYIGEIELKQVELKSFITAAECLKIKGLAADDVRPTGRASHSESEPLEDSVASRKRQHGESSLPTKKRVKETMCDNIDIKAERIEVAGEDIEQNMWMTLMKNVVDDEKTITRGAHSPENNEDRIGENLQAELEKQSQYKSENSHDGLPQIQKKSDSLKVVDEIIARKESFYQFDQSGAETRQSSEKKENSDDKPLLFSSSTFPNLEHRSHNLSNFSSSFAPNLNDYPVSPFLDFSEGGKASNFPESILFKEATEFFCQFCGKGFIQKCLLNRHLKIHSNEEKCKCPFCPYETTFRFNLKSHMLRKHLHCCNEKCSHAPI